MSEKLLYKNKKSKVYRLDDSKRKRPFLLKIFNFESHTPADISPKFYNEFEIVEDLSLHSEMNTIYNRTTNQYLNNYD